MYTPNSIVKFLSLPVGKGENVYFVSDETLLSFSDHDEKGLRSVEGTNDYKCSLNIDKSYKYNYIAYKNRAYENKWFFAEITNRTYDTNNSTILSLKLDPFLTWKDEIVFKKTFVERMTVEEDYYNTLSDDPATGKLKEIKSDTLELNGGYLVFLNSSLEEEVESVDYTFSIGSFSFPGLILFFSNTQAISMQTILRRIANQGLSNRIISVIYIPLINNVHITLKDTENIGTIPILNKLEISSLTESKNFNIEDVDFPFKKLLTYPYSKIIVTDMITGQQCEYCANLFDNPLNFSFTLRESFSTMPTLKIFPTRYNNEDISIENSLVIKCNTSLPVANNTYAQYMMQNSTGNNLNIIGSIIGGVGTALTGNPLGVVGGVLNIANVINAENQAHKMPNQVTEINDSAYERLCYSNTIKISLFSMDNDHKNAAIDYWSNFGYPVRRFMNINLADHTGEFKYIKTVNSNIESANIPINYIQELNELFDRGVKIYYNLQ